MYRIVSTAGSRQYKGSVWRVLPLSYMPDIAIAIARYVLMVLRSATCRTGTREYGTRTECHQEEVVLVRVRYLYSND